MGQALAGSQSAFEQIVARYQRPVVSLIARMTGDRALAEDLAARAATTLSALCHSGHCACSPAVLEAVGKALTNRPDAVSAPALGVFASCGTAEHVPARSSGRHLGRRTPHRQR